MAEPVVRARSETEDAYELDYLRGYLERDPSCPAREVRDEILRRLHAVPSPPPHAYIIPHRGDPCILCRKPMEEFEPGGCPVTVRQIYSRIGQIVDEANAAWERVDGHLHVTEAHQLEEEAKRLRLLHLVLTRDLVPASDLATALPKPEGA